MAAIGKIRSWGPVLVGIIALALFGFIATDLTKSCETTTNQKRQQVGEVLGNKLAYPEFEAMINEYEEALKFLGYDMKDDARTELSDYVWQNYVQNTIIANECEKLGLEVTDAELAGVLKSGTNPVLYQLRIMPNMPSFVLPQFFNQQTGRFDYSIVTTMKQNLQQAAASDRQAAEYYPLFENYWKLVEKLLRQQLLSNKYQALLAGTMLSNPVSAKMAFDAQNTESEIQLALLPYSSINDNDINITDADLKAKYDELKDPRFKLLQEQRDIKYVVCQVKPSDIDRAKLMASMDEAAAQLKADSVPAELVVHNFNSDVNYLGLPVTRAALQKIGIAACVDTLAVGQTTNPFQLGNDREGYTLNVVKLLAKTTASDSIQYRMIRVGGASQQEAANRADSIYQALKGGENFDTLAVKYGESGAKVWFTTASYENESNLNSDAKQLYKTLLDMPVNELKTLALTQFNVVMQVTDRRKPVEKYDVALVKRVVDFSDSTAIATYNTFSQYVSESQTIEALEANAAQYGYNVQSARIPNNVHYIAGLRGTHPLLKWVFEAKEGAVSQPTDKASDQYGKSDYIVVAAVEKIHPAGYYDLASQTDVLRQEVMKDKKFQQLAQTLNGVKTVAEAEQKGARVETVTHVTFPTRVTLVGQGVRESSLSGAVAGTAKGEVCKHVVKGDNGAYLFQVTDRTEREGAQFNAAATETQLTYQALQSVFRTVQQDLESKAKIVDNRYLFL